jgi:hypothetical protein
LGYHRRHFGLAVRDLLRAVSVITAVSWDQRFSDPIILPGGKKLVTLRDAALYIGSFKKVATNGYQTGGRFAISFASSVTTSIRSVSSLMSRARAAAAVSSRTRANECEQSPASCCRGEPPAA